MVVVRGENALAVGAATTTNRVANFTYSVVGKGTLVLWARSTATASSTMVALCSISGIPVGPATGSNIFPRGATGALNKNTDNIFAQKVSGGTIELYFQDTVAGSTVDYQLEFFPG